MPRQYKDLIVDEPDHMSRITLLNRDGSVALRDVSVQLSSPIAQEGDRWGAKEANLLLEMGEDGIPRPIVAYEKTYKATVGTVWNGDGPWTQTIAVVGIAATDNPVIDLVLTGVVDTDRAILEAWGMVSRIVTAPNSITVTCYDDKPEVSIQIQIKAVR